MRHRRCRHLTHSPAAKKCWLAAYMGGHDRAIQQGMRIGFYCCLTVVVSAEVATACVVGAVVH